MQRRREAYERDQLLARIQSDTKKAQDRYMPEVALVHMCIEGLAHTIA